MNANEIEKLAKMNGCFFSLVQKSASLQCAFASNYDCVEVSEVETEVENEEENTH